jgi:hypothetical protein
MNCEVAPAADCTLRPGLAFFPLDDALVVFSETSQSLVGLNATAAFIVGKLREGVPASHLAAALVAEKNVGAEDAPRWVDATLDGLRSQRLLSGGPPLPPAPVEEPPCDRVLDRRRAALPPLAAFEPAAEVRYRLLGTCALIRYGHWAQRRQVDAVIGHLCCDAPDEPTLVIDITADFPESGHLASNIYCDGKAENQALQLSRLGPMVKSALWLSAVNAHDFILDLHAGVVGAGGRCILLPAAAGSGKSSLTAALTHSGLGYYSDEVALIEPDTFQVPPVPLAVCVKDTGWDLMSRFYPQIPDLRIHRRDDGKVVRYVAPSTTAIQKEPAQVSHIFFPRYAAGEQTQLLALSRSEALARLMDQCLALRMRMDGNSVGELVRWIAQIDCYALSFSSLDEGVGLVRSTARL